MFWRDTQLVHGPEGVIPFLVRLESFEEIPDFRWQILAASGQIVQHVSFSWPERKFGRFGGAIPGVLDADSESGLVESRAKIAYAIEDDVGNVCIEPLCEPELENVSAAISILLNDYMPWLAFQEGIDLRFPIGQMTFCSSEHALRALEDVSHGQIRSDKESRIPKDGARLSEEATPAA